jgi:thiamine kinase-like enzyme
MNLVITDILKIITEQKILRNEIQVNTISGGITNQNYIISDDTNEKYFVRLADDIPEHLVYRSNEIMVCKAASKCNITPYMVYNTQTVQVSKFIEGKTYTVEDVKANIDKIIKIVKKAHNEIPKVVEGNPIVFDVFDVIRHYKEYLEKNNSSWKNILDDLLKKSDIIEQKSKPYDEIVLSHNDLLSANFMECREQLWLIDWEYSGFNTPLFDLGGLSSNNDFNEEEEKYLLENYFEDKISDDRMSKYKAIKCASLLREAMWSMVAEIISKIDFDYNSYTKENLTKFEKVFEEIMK